ncbi:hypothetical protein F4780DRAFT_620756 [Xylariomycetidae sp. FL0641]|nr:hypothetical protein F4780DRAFT_620756 [Xylariomycetidae sp. FL0641]
MISMQRSLSSPVCVQCSPPTSPTATRPPSRPPTPPPVESRADQDAPRPRTRPSRSPSRPTRAANTPESTVSLPVRRSADVPRDGRPTLPPSSHSAASAQKPIVAQVPIQPATSPAPSPRTASDSPLPPASGKGKGEAPSRPRPAPLISDPSLYTNPQLVLEDEGTTLEELAHLVRLSKYQERKRANTRVRLQRSLISTALSARLTRCGEIAQKNLADNFRQDEAQAFASLYGAILDVRNSCDATRRYALLEPDMDPLYSPAMASTESLEYPPSLPGIAGAGSVTPFLGSLSVPSREAILHFLTQIRTNPDYLAARLCSLKTTDLQALTVFHQGLEPIESVMPFHNHSSSSGRGAASSANRRSNAGPNAVERLLSFQRHDPLSALIYTCFANPAGPDSAEDRRRTTVWATACARLISSETPYENVLVSILNVWAAMRDWSGRSHMEWFIMKILEEGAFLLDKAEDSKGTRFNVSNWSSKDTIAAEEFYEKAVDELFELIDDEDATGIPEGVIELGNEIIRQLEETDPRAADSLRPWFVYKWLFSNWLHAVVIHPESFGMMTDYYITEYGRQKILKTVVGKATDVASGMLWQHHPRDVSTEPKYKDHLESILGRFQPSRNQGATRLLPARSITTLRETAEVHPYLLVSPADLVTMVNALFPERRPQSAHSSSLRSGAPSVSGFSSMSQPISVGTSKSTFETASVASTSFPSTISDATTSLEPLMDGHAIGTPLRYSPPIPDAADQKSPTNYDEDGPHLRAAIQEMARVLGAEAVAGSCHPCAERWAVLFVAPDGKTLSPSMTYDPDDEIDDEKSSITSEVDDDEIDDRPELDKDYHQLRDSILRLVEDFEIPQGLENPDSQTTFSNRVRPKKYVSKNKVITPESSMGSNNPYRKRELLITMLNAAASQSRIQSDFVSAHLYWKTLQQLNTLTPSLRQNGFAALLSIFSKGPQDTIRRSASATEEYDAWLVWLKQSQERHEGLIEGMMKRLRNLRDKMWYVTNVRVSEVYEHTRHICNALKTMGVQRKWDALQREQSRLGPRGSALSVIHLQSFQMLNLLAASEEQGGPNKLSDDQAEKTSKWLEQTNIQNYCGGEERIHRFCCEIDNCLGKLVGDSFSANPVLWSSSLYQRERKLFEVPRRSRDRESVFSGDDTASVMSDDRDRRYTPSSSTRPSSSVRDLRSVGSHNFSQISIDSSRHSFSRASTAVSEFDPRDYGLASPVHTIDSFWSPMSTVSSATSRAQSPTTSVTNLSSTLSQSYRNPLHSTTSLGRHGTSVSSTETVHLHRLTEEKQKFLSDLRQTTLGLLLSDLGNFVYSRGSETDDWFNTLGQEQLEPEEFEDSAMRPPQRRKDPSNHSSRVRVVEKKKSWRNLREAGEAGLIGSGLVRHGSPSNASNDSHGTNTTIPARTKPAKKQETSDFPYMKSYQRLLKMFSIHPNPYTKLNILIELEQLIIASLSTKGRRSRWASRSQTIVMDDSGTSGRTDSSNSTEQNSRDRRPSTFQSVMTPGLRSQSPGNAETRSVISMNPANKNAIQNVLQTLFRDAKIRPQTLFRDLQYIGSFIPASVLDADRSNAYWDAGIAALSLKQDVVAMMVERADKAVDASRGPSSSNGNAREPVLSLPSLAEAARMLTVAAKEGNHTAQRELGLFHLGNPELVPRAILPLSRPKDVFKQSVMERFRGSGTRHPSERSRPGPSMADAGGDVRSDPALMCVAWHWMEAAEQGGDELAKTFLRQQDEIRGIGS